MPFPPLHLLDILLLTLEMESLNGYFFTLMQRAMTLERNVFKLTKIQVMLWVPLKANQCRGVERTN